MTPMGTFIHLWKWGRSSHLPIGIKVKVKQGNPMLPLLINLALDPLISVLEKSGRGFLYGAQKVTALAFADDLVLFSDLWEGMNEITDIPGSFCRLSSLKVQARKCHKFFLSPTHNSYTVNNSAAWKISTDGLNMIIPGKSWCEG